MADINSIKKYFDDEEWGRLTTLEKTRLMNIKRNYEMMKSAGLNPKVPQFMMKRRKTDLKHSSNIFRKGDVDLKSSEVMKNTKSVKEIRKINSGKRKDILLSTKTRIRKEPGKKMAEVNWGVYDMNFTRKEKNHISDLLKRAEKNLESLKSYFSLRNSKTTVKDAESFNCEDCDREYEGDCPVDGSLLLGPIRKVLPGHCPDRAVRTCPLFLSVCRSGITGAGLGIWTEILLPKGIIFGPYQGKVVNNRKQAEITRHDWEVSSGGKVDHYVEGSNPSASNWLWFVNCAQYVEQQNLVAFQYGGAIFYKTYKEVLPFTELLVWYGDEYAAELGIDSSEDNPKAVRNASNSDLFCSTRRKFLGVYSDSQNSFSSDNLKVPNHSVESSGEHPVCEYSRKKASNSGTGFHRRPEKSHLCINCGETFGNRWNLNVHRQIHINKSIIEVPSENPESSDYEKKGEKCPYCAYRTTRSCLLRRHVTTVHLGEKRFKCQHCEYRAVQSWDLKKHANAVHLVEKRYKCHHCEYRAAASSDLKIHVNAVHLGHKPYKCPHCAYRAAYSFRLNTHVNAVHLGRKPYKCPHCEHRAADSSNLKRHVNALHLGK